MMIADSSDDDRRPINGGLLRRRVVSVFSSRTPNRPPGEEMQGMGGRAGRNSRTSNAVCACTCMNNDEI